MPFDRLRINSPTDLNIKLLKTVTVKVLESNYFRKLSYGIANVVEGGGEGRIFL